eukprot:3765328-Pyramimonas_sp.AAC.1
MGRHGRQPGEFSLGPPRARGNNEAAIRRRPGGAGGNAAKPRRTHLAHEAATRRQPSGTGGTGGE